MSLAKRRIRNYLTPDYMAMEFRYGTLTEGVQIEIIVGRGAGAEAISGPVYYHAKRPTGQLYPRPANWIVHKPDFAEVWKVLQETWKKIQEEKKNGA